MELQSIVSENILLEEQKVKDKNEVYVDLGSLDFDKLKAAFLKQPKKNSITYNLQQAIEKKLQQMLRENPLRLEFYERYKEIIKAYNEGKSLENTERAFERLNNFVKELTLEEKRAVKENLKNQETLAIFDLLTKDKALNAKERKQVKKVAEETLEKLKAEKLKVERWRESRQITAQVKQLISDQLYHLPQESYPDEELKTLSTEIYQHIFSNYYGNGQSIYDRRA